jgi:hypothetical protein
LMKYSMWSSLRIAVHQSPEKAAGSADAGNPTRLCAVSYPARPTATELI